MNQSRPARNRKPSWMLALVPGLPLGAYRRTPR